jgi:hypothetical protein
MSSKPVCQVARSWVDVGSFYMRLFGVVYFAIASVREFLDTPSYSVIIQVFENVPSLVRKIFGDVSKDNSPVIFRVKQ